MNLNDFKHVDPDDFHDKELTLHDCIANKILMEEGMLRFYLPDGFWITSNHKENLSGKILRTDASVVEFYVENIKDISVEVFTRKKWCWSRNTIVESWSFAQLISAINSGKCTVEFLYQYRNCYEQLWHCIINSNKKPYNRYCHLYFPNTHAVYYWNNLCLDREW